MPGIGPRTAAALVAGVDISPLPGCDKLASYCGVAPADSRSGTGVRSTRPQRGGSKPLENPRYSPATRSSARRTASGATTTSAARGRWGTARR
ncbi:transposase [Adlercreutzia caecimuris]|uniref:transposase n=1 Tax=Adlercreutzia caecimuris TaxID=671266 RepID=UPI00338F3B6C